MTNTFLVAIVLFCMAAFLFLLALGIAILGALSIRKKRIAERQRDNVQAKLDRANKSLKRWKETGTAQGEKINALVKENTQLKEQMKREHR